jgi:hypothetical protein
MKSSRFLIAMATLLVAGAAMADVEITVPEKAEAQPGRFLVLKAKTTGKVVKWVSLSKGADVLPYIENQAIFVSPTPGEHRVLAYTAAGDVPSEPAICTVTVQGQPPAPVPPAPGPSDLTRDFATLYAADASASKAEHLSQLADLYDLASGYANDPNVKTVGSLAARVSTAAKSLLPDGALLTIRQRIAAEIARDLGTDEADLTADRRKKAGEAFARIATALKGVK